MLFRPSMAIVSALLVACAHARRSPSDATTTSPPPQPQVTESTEIQARRDAGSLEQMLAGRIAGVSVTATRGGGIRVRMMGAPTSFMAGQEPLIIVDDVPIAPEAGGTLSWLSPHDIESIQAFKDPSQTAIFGVRGANGVIVIRTKGSH